MASLLSSLQLRDVKVPNRMVLAPICQYVARDGFADDFHFVHLGRFALGGFGIVFTEAVAVTPEGRISHGDLGLWSDAHLGPLERICRFIRAQGAVPAIQISHAGRKASTRRPWRGEGTVTGEDFKELGDEAWQTVAPSAIAQSARHAAPSALDKAGMERIATAFAEAAARACEAGFDIIEVHAAHGYLLNQFLSPVANKRSDEFGGNRGERMRFPLEVVRRVRHVWPDKKPLFVRVSVTDHIADGWAVEDTLDLAQQLKNAGTDVVNCSSGGFKGAALNALSDYHVPYAEQIFDSCGMPTMAAGRMTTPQQAADVIASGKVSLVAIARAAEANPNWANNAKAALGDAA